MFQQAMVRLRICILKPPLISQQLQSFPRSLAGRLQLAVREDNADYIASAISIVVGQTITLSTIKYGVRREFTERMATTIIAAGPTNLSESSFSPKDLVALRSIWNTAVIRTMFLALAMACMAIPCTLGMEWLNTKKIAAERKAKLDDSIIEENQIVSPG